MWACLRARTVPGTRTRSKELHFVTSASLSTSTRSQGRARLAHKEQCVNLTEDRRKNASRSHPGIGASLERRVKSTHAPFRDHAKEALLMRPTGTPTATKATRGLSVACARMTTTTIQTTGSAPNARFLKIVLLPSTPSFFSFFASSSLTAISLFTFLRTTPTLGQRGSCLRPR